MIKILIQKYSKKPTLAENFKEVVENKIHEDMAEIFELNRWFDELVGEKAVNEPDCNLGDELERIKNINSLALKLQNDYISYLETGNDNDVDKIRQLLKQESAKARQRLITIDIDDNDFNDIIIRHRSVVSERIINEMQDELLEMDLIKQKRGSKTELNKFKKQLEKKYNYSKLLRRKYPTVRRLMQDLILMEVCEEGACRYFVGKLRDIR